MRALGAQLHMHAGEFVLTAQNATATGGVRKLPQLLGRMLQICVECPATYQLECGASGADAGPGSPLASPGRHGCTYCRGPLRTSAMRSAWSLCPLHLLREPREAQRQSGQH
jgi:hypothetical protein